MSFIAQAPQSGYARLDQDDRITDSADAGSPAGVTGSSSSTTKNWLHGTSPLYMVETPPFTVEAPGYTKVEGETIPRRHPKAQNGLLTIPAPGVYTALDLLKRSTQLYPNEPAMGSRRLLKTHRETKKIPKVVGGETIQVDKEWTYFELSGYEYITYQEYLTKCLQIGAGLKKLGMSQGDRLHFFASTSANWLTLSHAAVSQALTIVTAYDTLGESGVKHSLVQTGAKAMYVDPHLLKTATNPLKEASDVRIVIYNDATTQPIPDQQLAEWKAAHPNHTVLSVSELQNLGQSYPANPCASQSEDLFCIMYTSGTTGPPKGVPVTHAQFVSAIAGLHSVIEETVSNREAVLAYLPLAHIFELVVENLVLLIGGTLGYGSPRTLADSSMRNCYGDMREFRPTVMVGVPQIWETVRKGVVSKVEGSGLVIKSLFWAAFKIKSFLVAAGLPGQTIFDGPVFGKVRDSTGGRLRFIMNGASGIASRTQHFLSMVVAPMVTGYGLTETCASGAMGNPLQYTSKAIGPIPASVEVKLVSIPELNYSADASPPQGEILIRGGPVITGYYKNPEESQKALTPDGWFKSGDIGEFDHNGHLKVIDRLKNLVKLQGGEYIALEHLESIYRGSPLVQNIMVHGTSEHPRAIAVVSPNDKTLGDIAQKLGVEQSRMCDSKEVKDAVLKDLTQVGKKAGLSPLELIAGVVITSDEWTPANGLVSATQKVNRKNIQEKYKNEIKQCFGS